MAAIARRPRMRVYFAFFWWSAWLTLCGGPPDHGWGRSVAFASTIVTRVVRTKYGDLTGTIVTPSGRYLDAVEVYRGVPYAAPPVGTLRFMPPVSGALWTGVKMADRFAPVCPQKLPNIDDEEVAVRRMSKGRVEFLKRLLPHLRNQSEDCLYLNIYAPTQEGDELKKYPVLVFIHGESYEWNSGNPYDGTVLASFAGLVVVTINYRLGVLGFLNTNTDVNQKSPSNYGLMDQIAALHWLQENVAYFGGDPTNVTLVGHGTGASCVNFLMSSTAVPEGLLFHRVILMSGSSLSPWALVKEPSTYARQVAHYVNCSFQLPHQILLKCLRDRPLESLLNVTVHVSEFNTAFGPNIDGVIIDIVLSEKMKIGNLDSTHVTETDANAEPEYTKRPFHDIPVSEYASTILNNRATKEKLISKYSRYDMMTGVVSADSFFAFSNHDIQYGIEPDRRSKILKTFVKYTYRYHLSEILATIVNEYTEWEKPIQHPVSIRDETLEALSDAQYVGPVTQTVDLHASARKNNSYFYVFEYQSKYSFYQQRQGCVHGEELPYLFGAPLVNGLEHFSQNYTKAEISLSEAFMLYVSNFARTGNPNDPGPSQTTHQRSTPDRNRLKNVQWAPYESGPKKYLSLDTKIKLKNHYRSHKLSIWMYLIPELHKPGSDDVPPSHHQFPPDEVLYPQYPQPSFKISNATSVILKTAAHNDSFNSTFDLPVVMVASSSSDRNAMTQNDDVGGGNQQRMARDKAFNMSLAVIVTIGIGCLLISMNLVVFFVIYRKRHHTRSSGDKNSGSTRSLSSNNSLIVGPEGGAQNTKKITENGGPSLNIKTNVVSDSRDRDLYHNIETKSKSYIVDQSVMFVLEPLKHPDYDFDYGKQRNENDLHKSHCATLPKHPGRPGCKSSNDITPSYWPAKLEGSGAGERTEMNSRNACELGLGTIPRPPKSILKHQSVNTDIAPKCQEDYTRIRV